MVSVLTSKQITETFKKRMELLGKSPFGVPTGEGEEGEGGGIVLKPKGRNLPKWTRENAAEQEYKALLSEGVALYRRNEYHRAIEAFTKASEQGTENSSNEILIDRADCYIQVGKPELALEDVNRVLQDNPKNPRAILTKAEAYFSMGEFEFALVFFQRGLSIRRDMIGFKDGVTKAKHAILDAINGDDLFQPNPNYATSRPRKPLVEVKEKKITPEQLEEEQRKKEESIKLLPEKVAPLVSTDQKHKFLGELSLDYEFLIELQAELENQSANYAVTEENGKREEHGKKEDAEIKVIVDDALDYLNQRGAFWSQQGVKTQSGEDSPSKDKSLARPKPDSTAKSSTTKSKTNKALRNYEKSKIEQYEEKYGTRTSEAN